MEIARRSAAIPAAVHRDRIERVIAHMHGSLASPLRLEDMAQIANLSPYYFERVFLSLTGVSAVAFQTSLRLEAAKRALLRNDGTVTDVCFELGFESLGSFTTRFGAAVGLSPAAFRSKVERYADVDMRNVLRAAANERSTRENERSIRVSLRNSGTEEAVTWVGIFPKGIPDRRPAPGTIAIGDTICELGPVEVESGSILAASFPLHASIVSYLTGDDMRLGTTGPVRFAPHQTVPFVLPLRQPAVTDPPILIALPLFTLWRDEN